MTMLLSKSLVINFGKLKKEYGQFHITAFTVTFLILFMYKTGLEISIISVFIQLLIKLMEILNPMWTLHFFGPP
jgi:hypothetical protein